MKKNMIPVALFAVLATMAVSCQKENVLDFISETAVSEASTVYTVQYAVDGVLHSATIHNEAEEQALMQYLMALTREGHEVSIYDEEAYSHSVATKETQVHTTTSEANATTWTLQKIHEGYKVTTIHNTDTGEYTCIATR